MTIKPTSGRPYLGRNPRNSNGATHRPNSAAPVGRDHVFDSKGFETRSRGTAGQLVERYTQLAADAASSGDHVAAQSHLQHAEHYLRVRNAVATRGQESGPSPERDQNI